MATIVDVTEALNVLGQYAGFDLEVDAVDGVLLAGPSDLEVDPSDALLLENLGWFIEGTTRRWAKETGNRFL